MRQIFTAILFVSFFVIATTFAQVGGSAGSNVEKVNNGTSVEPGGQSMPSITNVSVLIWAKKNPIDWFSGVLFALTGLIGSLVTLFAFVGGAVPGTMGQVNIIAETDRLKTLCKKQDDLLNKDGFKTGEAHEIEATVGNLRDSLYKEKWHQFGFAFFLYALIGAFFATFIAQDALQALLIGAGWTGYLGAVGLKSESKESGSRKNDAIDDLIKQTRERDNHIEKLEDNLDELLNENRMRDKYIKELEAKLPKQEDNQDG